MFVRRIGVDITCNFAMYAFEAGKLEEVRVRQKNRVFLGIGQRSSDPDSAFEGLTAARALSESGSGGKTASIGILGRGGQWEAKSPSDLFEGHMLVGTQKWDNLRA